MNSNRCNMNMANKNTISQLKETWRVVIFHTAEYSSLFVKYKQADVIYTNAIV